MTLKFKPEDFEQPFVGTLTTQYCANIANSVFYDWLQSLPKAYGYYDITYGTAFVDGELHNSLGKPTHEAYLVDIKEIKKPCEHFPEVMSEGDYNWFKCRDCGVRLKPSGWVEE